MEVNIVSNLNPVYSQLYRDAFRENKLNVYVKEFNVDGWIRSLDFYLVYEKDEQLDLARRVVRDLALDTGETDQGSYPGKDNNKSEQHE